MVSVESLEHVHQRRWWLYKVWAPSKIIIFHGAQIDTALTWVRKSAMELKFWWGIWRMRTTRRRLLQVGKHQNQTNTVPLESLEHVDQRRWWPYKVWAPLKILIFHRAQIHTVLTWVRKNAMEPKFWWGILRMRTTCRRALQIGKDQNQRRWCR